MDYAARRDLRRRRPHVDVGALHRRRASPRTVAMRPRTAARLPRCAESRYIQSAMRIPVLIALSVAALLPQPMAAQEHPVRRVANVVSVAVEEYGKGVDEHGRVTSTAELQEATDFLADAKLQ